jgi:hypothetical protein
VRVATDGTNIATQSYAGVLLSTVNHATQSAYVMTAAYSSVSYITGNSTSGISIGTNSSLSQDGGAFAGLFWTVAEYSSSNVGADAHKVFGCQLGIAGGTACGGGGQQTAYDGTGAVPDGGDYANPGPIVFDGANKKLYWVDQGPAYGTSGTLFTCDIASYQMQCSNTAVLASGLPYPVDIAQDTNNIYIGSYVGGTGSIRSCAKSGCSGTPTVLAGSEGGGVQYIAADPGTSGTVYWTTYGSLRRVAKP